MPSLMPLCNSGFFKGLFRILFSAVLVIATVHAIAQPSEQGSEYGQKLIAEYDLSPQQIAKFAAFKPSAPDPHESTLVNSLLAASEDWIGDNLRADATSSPYTLVVTLIGTAQSDGDVSTMWKAGWKMEDGVTKLLAFPGLSKSGMKAGEHVTITKASPPSRFTEIKNVSPVLAMVNANNFKFETVKVQLWSGIGNPSKTQMFFSFYWLLIGLVMFTLVWWFRRP